MKQMVEEKQRSPEDYQVSNDVKGSSKDEGRHRTAGFLTHGTTEEGLDFVSVLQPVPHMGKHSQSGYLAASMATGEVDKGMDASREREMQGRRGAGKKGQDKGKKVTVKKCINKKKGTGRTYIGRRTDTRHAPILAFKRTGLITLFIFFNYNLALRLYL